MKGRKLLMLLGSLCLAIVLLVPLVVGCTSETPGTTTPTEAEYKWRFGSPETEPIRNESYALFCDLVNVYSEGRIEIEFFPDGLLGDNSEEFLAMQEGSIEIASLYPYTDIVPGGMLNWMPWTVGSYEEAAMAFSIPDGILYQVMEEAWNEVGGHLLMVSPGGPYGIGNNVRPLKTPDDFENLKMRVSGSLSFVKTLQNMAEGSGMTVETIPWSDLYGALETGVVDGCWDLWVDMVGSRHMEVLKYYTALGFGWDSGNLVMNKQVWDALPSDLQDAVIKAARLAEERDYQAHRLDTMNFVEAVIDAGVEVYFPTAEERAAFRDKANMPAIWDELCAPWLEQRYPGQNMMQTILDELDRIYAEATAAGG